MYALLMPWLLLGSITAGELQPPECVVLLHGLARSSASMRPIQSALEEAGFDVVNVDYPSRHKPIEELAAQAVESGVRDCPAEASAIHFVTHSLGGILVRYHVAHARIERLGRVVMLAPPNQGSEVVDKLRDIPGFETIFGPAGLQLGTGPESIPAGLGPVEFELGVIAGTRTLNPLLSQWLSNPDDGKVSARSTKVQGMTDFITVPHSHTFIMRTAAVIEQVLHFLRRGRFCRTPGGAPCPAGG